MAGTVNPGSLPKRGFVTGLLAVLLAAGGLLAFQRGLEARAEAEPAALVTGAGFLPGVDGEEDAEIRTPGSVTLIAPGVRALGAGWRRAGVALMAAALALAAAARPGQSAASSFGRLLWVGLGAAGLVLLVARASAGAASAAVATDGFRGGALLFGLGLVLAFAWGRDGRTSA